MNPAPRRFGIAAGLDQAADGNSGQVRALLAIGGFPGWWISELRAMLPTRRPAAGISVPSLVVTQRGESVALLVEENGRCRDATPDAAVGLHELAGALRRVWEAEGRLAIRIRVREADCFVRSVELPAAARRDFERLLILDLERSTPIKAADVHSAFIVESPRKADGMAEVRQLVLKRRTVAPLLRQLEAAGFEPASIDCWNGEEEGPLPLDFLATGNATAPAQRANTIRILGSLTGILALSAIGIYWCQLELGGFRLAAEIARLQTSTIEARQALAQSELAAAEFVRIHRLADARAPATAILEDVARLLPDTAWLEEFRLDGDIVEIAGFAASATALLAVIERSTLFNETQFTAPVRLEPGDHREKFRLRTRLRAPAPAATGTGPEAVR